MPGLELEDTEVAAEDVEGFVFGESEGGIVGGSRDGVAGDGVAAEVGLWGDVFFAAGHHCSFYAAHGVREYWLADPEPGVLEQYRCDDLAAGFELVLKSSSGRLRSGVLPGFDIPIEALFDQTANMGALREMM